jgi:hypothetical protein
MFRPLKPTEVLQDMLLSTFTSSRRNADFGPGQWVLKSRPDIREKLSQLKSEDLLNLRPDLCICESEETIRRREISEMLIEFDKKCKK